jgi:hypothetical protein
MAKLSKEITLHKKSAILGDRAAKSKSIFLWDLKILEKAVRRIEVPIQIHYEQL